MAYRHSNDTNRYKTEQTISSTKMFPTKQKLSDSDLEKLRSQQMNVR
jgi:hypothetical protein